MVINRGSFVKSLTVGVNKWYGDAYAEYPEEYNMLFSKNTDSRAFVEDVGMSGFGMASQLGEGEAVNYDNMIQAFITRYQHVKYGLGFIITSEAIEDDQYMQIAQKRARGLAFSMRQTKETVAANVYNRAFSTTYLGGDGSSLVASAGGGGSATHPNAAGGTWTNGPSAAVDLSEAALEQACIDISKWTDDRGLKIAVLPTRLIIPFDLSFEASRILEGDWQPDSTNRNINVLNKRGLFSEVVANHYLTDTDAWFIMTNIPDGMKYFERKADTFGEDNDFDTDNLKYKATARYSFGWTDPRGIWGSPGV